VDPPASRPGLGDGFRLEAAIVVWEEPSVLSVPVGALFRHGDSWAVFRAAGGRAELREVAIGRRNGVQAQVLSGLDVRDDVVVYPSDRVRDGVRIRTR
jgi:HlyD family secretion protein